MMINALITTKISLLSVLFLFAFQAHATNVNSYGNEPKRCEEVEERFRAGVLDVFENSNVESYKQFLCNDITRNKIVKPAIKNFRGFLAKEFKSDAVCFQDFMGGFLGKLDDPQEQDRELAIFSSQKTCEDEVALEFDVYESSVASQGGVRGRRQLWVFIYAIIFTAVIVGVGIGGGCLISQATRQDCW